MFALSIHSFLIHKLLNVLTRFSSSFSVIMSTLGKEEWVCFGGSTEDMFKQFCFWCLMVNVIGGVGRLVSVVV
jgi:hypothetical protein